jgi:hypothetical protein
MTHDWLKTVGRPLMLLLFLATVVVTVSDAWQAFGTWKWYAAGAAALYFIGYLVWEGWGRRLPPVLKPFEAAGKLGEGDASDAWFQWTLARRVLTVEPPNAEYEQSEDGFNVSGKAVDHIVRTVAGDSPVQFKNIGFQAWYRVNEEAEQEANVEPEEQYGKKFRCRISFPGQVVPNGARLRTRRRLLWPASVGLDRDYWLIPMHYPAARMQAEFRFRVKPRNISFWHCPKNETSEQPLELKAPVTENGFVVYKTEIPGEPGWYAVIWTLN